MYLELVANTPDCLDVPESVVLDPEFLADAFDMRIHGPGIAEVLIPPDGFEQLFA